MTPFNFMQIAAIGWLVASFSAANLWPDLMRPGAWVAVGFLGPFATLTLGKIMTL